MKAILAFLDRRSLAGIWVISLGLVLVIGIGDLYTGTEISTSIFYVMPVAIASWYGNRNVGIVLSIIAALVWLATEIGGGREYPYTAIYIWNMLVRLGLFLIIALLLRNFKDLLITEETAADTDYLTGALNTRGFYERMQQEIDRSARTHKPFTVAYIDLDNFKVVNDSLGHAISDELLISVVKILDDNLRKIDVLARLGGDEFAILFIETNNEDVKSAFTHVHRYLRENMQKNNWPVTFSVGIVTFETPPLTSHHALNIADEVMYLVKRYHKDSVVYQIWNTGNNAN